MDQHLAILQVVIPLLLAPICILFSGSRVPWLLALLGSIWSFLCAVLLLQAVLSNGPIDYVIGGWDPPWGIAYRIDEANAFVLVLLGMIATTVAAYAPRSVAHEIDADKTSLFYSSYLLCLTGLMGIAATADAFNLFVFLEISSLSTYAMIAMGKDRRALTASFQYLIMGTIGATFILIGVGLLYMMTGTLNMADLAARLPAVSDTTTVRAAFAFLTVGISLKVALAPLHMWLPNAYAYAPSVVTAFLAATATKVSLYVLLRIFFSVFGVDFSFNDMQLDAVLLPLSLLAIFGASLAAIFQNNIKRMLAWSSIAQVGYMTLGVSLINVTALTGAVVHLFNHALIKGGLFLAVGGIVLRCGGARLESLAGAGRKMPWTMGALVIGGCGLIGVPLTAGFVSKWYLVIGALEADLWPVALAIVVASLLALIYVWRLVETLYFAGAEETSVQGEAPLELLLPTWILIGASVYFGVFTDASAGVAAQVANALLGTMP